MNMQRIEIYRGYGPYIGLFMPIWVINKENR